MSSDPSDNALAFQLYSPADGGVQLTVEQIVAIHDNMIEKHGGQYGVLDNNLLESVVQGPYQEFFGMTLFPTVMDKAAKYMFDFSNYQIFCDGNKRTGAATADVFLQLNGLSFDEKAQGQLYQLTLDIANHRFKDSSEIVPFLSEHVKPLGPDHELPSAPINLNGDIKNNNPSL